MRFATAAPKIRDDLEAFVIMPSPRRIGETLTAESKGSNNQPASTNISTNNNHVPDLAYKPTCL
jgi:hypothetical protein